MRKQYLKMLSFINSFYLYSNKNKIKFILILLGMTIGIFSVTTILITSKVGKKLIYAEIETLGTNRLWVYNGLMDFMNYKKLNPSKTNKQISNKDVQSLSQNYEDIQNIAPSICWNGPVTYKGKIFKNIKLVGTIPEWIKIYDEHLLSGRFIKPVDHVKRNLVCVLSNKAYKKIFSNNEAIGYNLQITDEYLKVIGILEDKDRPILESMNLVKGDDEIIFIPLGLMQSQNWFNTQLVQCLDMRVSDFNKSKYTARKIENYFKVQHGDNSTIKVKLLYSQVKTAQKIMQIISIVLGIISFIALLLAGTGIMNIMLSSVTERYYEIGIRRAVGATKNDILLQFVFEATAYGLLGGVLGIVGSICVYYISHFWFGICQVMILPSILIAMLMSLITGLTAGIYPAYKAANLNPIDALRSI